VLLRVLWKLPLKFWVSERFTRCKKSLVSRLISTNLGKFLSSKQLINFARGYQ
jgi:hypothetical protein